VSDATAAVRPVRSTGTPSLAVVGLACRFPDADDPAALLDLVLTGRRSFRRLPSARIDLADYYQPDLTTSDATYSTRAALLEGWQFDVAAFGIEPAAYFAADKAHWLALETTARALAAAGLPAGTGLDLDRTGVIIGNTLAGDTSRANALRVRWPYVRRVLTEALGAQEIPASQAGLVLQKAETSYLAPFPAMGPDSLAGSMPATIATAISGYFGFRGGSHAVDSACSSSLQAVASACAALAAGDLDAAIAGGVDLSLDPLELIGLAKAGVLATSDVRIYDREPTGYLPGEGCGVVVLMRTADARAAGLQVYAEILGWGTSGGGVPGKIESSASTQLLAMQRAYERAAVDPADIHFIEGNGAATSAGDSAELSALSTLRAGAKQPAALGSVKANIGHSKAAAGAAGLIKTVLALGTGVVPPTTGVHRPHELIAGGATGLVLPQAPADWASGPRLAAVSTMGIGGSNVHLVLRHEPVGRSRQDRWLRSAPWLTRATARPSPDGVQPRLQPEPEPTPFLLHAPDKYALAALLSRLADIASSLSDAEMQDLACALGRDPGRQGRARVALVATRQEQLAALAREAVTVLPRLADGLITIRPGIFASDDADGRVTLLLSGDASAHGGDGPDALPGPVALTSAVAHCLDTLRWLEALDVHATSAVGHGLGALAGLAWAGVLGEAEVVEIADLRTQFLLRSAAEADGGATVTTLPAPAGHAAHAGRTPADEPFGAVALRAAIAQRFRFGPPRRRLLSTMTGAEVDTVNDAIDLICSGFGGAERLAAAVADGAIGATLLVETGPGRTLASAAAAVSKVPAVSLQAGFTNAMDSARVAAALFAAGAIGQPLPLFAGRPARPVDIWRERVFITNPCQVIPQPTDPAESAPAASASPESPETAAAVGAPGQAAAHLGDRKSEAEDDGISSKRDEFERRLPERPLITAATGRAASPADTDQSDTDQSDSAQANSAQAGTAQPETAEPVPAAEQVPAAAPSAAAEAVPAAEQVPAAAPSAAATKPAALGKPVVHGRPAVPSKADAAAKPATTSAAKPPPAQDPDEIAVPSSQVAGPVEGLGSWARCFTEGLRPTRPPQAPAPALSWRMYAAARGPMLADVSSLFTADPAAGRTLAIVEDPADERSSAAAVEAARDAITTGELVVLTTSAKFTAFFASLHAEHPSIGITVLRLPAEAVSPDAIRRYAAAEVGQFRQLIIDTQGLVSESVPTEVALTGGGDFPLGPDDVILINRSTRGTGLVLAQVLACSGTGIAVVGRAGEQDDAELVAGLEQLRSAGARVGYEVIDIGDQASLAAAVRRIEDRLGPVTALAHSASADDHVPVLELTDAQVRMHLAGEISTLDLLACAIRPGQLKLIITIGTVADRYGLAGASLRALGGAVLSCRAAQLADASIGCQHLQLDVPAWSTSGFGDRPELATELAAADTSALDVGTASRMLLKAMTTPGLPADFALHGRIGGLAASPAPVITRAELAAAGLARGGRFLREVAVHYPGIELICSARLSLASDPYLADYRVDGMPVLPPVLALEALAQAASVLAGRPLRRAIGVVLGSPVLIPSGGDAALRVCALRDGDRIVAALRCADSSYRVDHASAEFSCAPGQPELPEVPLAAASSALHQLVAGPSGLVDGAELYGPISFQSGRFRRIALLPEVTARSARALVRGPDEHPWYPVGSELAATEFLLGSPGLNDAALQTLQACVPHRRVRAAACESVQFSGRSADGPVEIRALAEPVRPVGGEDTAPASTPDPGLVPGQPGAPEAETTGDAAPRRADDPEPRSAAAVKAAVADAVTAAAASHEMTPEELADMEGAERRPQSRKSRRSGRRNQGGRGGDHRSGASYPALHTWEVPASALSEPAGAAASSGAADVVAAAPTSTGEAGRRAGRPGRGVAAQPRLAPVPQLWNIEAVDAGGQLIATWRGVQLHDSGPLPRNAAWPPTLLSVYLERNAIDLGLDEGLRVTVSCGQPDGELPNPASAVPRQSPPGDVRRPGSGRHAGPERRAMNSASAPGTGALAGFALVLRAPVPVACGWAAVENGRRHHEPTQGMASAYAQLRTELAESPAVLAARLDAVRACLTMADLTTDDRAAGQLAVIRTTGDGWTVLALGRARIACAVVEMSGVAAPVAIAILTRQNAHARTAASRAAASVSTS
jgi:enediyne polyketide synthase